MPIRSSSLTPRARQNRRRRWSDIPGAGLHPRANVAYPNHDMRYQGGVGDAPDIARSLLADISAAPRNRLVSEKRHHECHTPDQPPKPLRTRRTARPRATARPPHPCAPESRHPEPPLAARSHLADISAVARNRFRGEMQSRGCHTPNQTHEPQRGRPANRTTPRDSTAQKPLAESHSLAMSADDF